MASPDSNRARDLLEHAKRSGLDPAHPALWAAGAALKESKESLR